MKEFYSISAGAFFNDAVYEAWPADAVELKAGEADKLREALGGQKLVSLDGDKLVITDPPVLEKDWRAEIAAARYKHETAGVAWGKFFIATDRESRNLLDQERSAVGAGLREENKGWKCLDTESGVVGFRPTSHDEIVDIAATTYRYVAACFQRESDLLDLVEKGTFKEYLLEKGWPSSAP